MKYKHITSGVTVDVRDDKVLGSEWVSTDTGSEATAPASTEFDPGAHNLDDVIAYLVDADDDERTRVLEAELGGKARKALADWQPPTSADD